MTYELLCRTRQACVSSGEWSNCEAFDPQLSFAVSREGFMRPSNGAGWSFTGGLKEHHDVTLVDFIAWG